MNYYRLNCSLFAMSLLLIGTWAYCLWHKDRKRTKKLEKFQKMWEDATRMARKS